MKKRVEINTMSVPVVTEEMDVVAKAFLFILEHENAALQLFKS